MIVIAELKTDDGKTVGLFILPEKEFKTGSRGFYGNGKVEINGKRYQTQMQLVEIGSKVAKPKIEPPEAQKKARRGSKGR